MKVLVLNDFLQKGGASIACKRTVDSLKSLGITVESISCDESNKNDHKTLFLGRKYQIFFQLFHKMCKANFIQKLRENELNNQFIKLLEHFRPELINIHNLHSAGLPISMVQSALRFSPVVWTLHDCWSFTGSYYPVHCTPADRSQKKCINTFWQTINKRGSNKSLSAITPSKWLKDQSSASHWKGLEVNSIANPIPGHFFDQLDRKACKSALGMGIDKPIALCIAGNLSEERKGGAILRKILKSGINEKIQFLLLGKDDEDSFKNFGVKCLGFVNDEITLKIAYHAADLLIHPAPIDNLPNTVAESMSCGTPVLAFKTGGLPEMVKTNKSGWLVNQIDARSMIEELDAILSARSYESLYDSTKSLAKSLFDSTKAGRNYSKHFSNILNS